MTKLSRTPLLGKGINARTIPLLNERVLYKHQKIVYASKGQLIQEDKVEQGILCVTDCTITFYEPIEEKAFDYNLTDIIDFSFKRGFLASEIEISLNKPVRVKLKDVPKGQEEPILGLLKQTIDQWKQFQEDQKSKGFFRYGLLFDKWGPKEEAKRWLNEYLESRGFKRVEDKWMTRQEYLDYCQRQKGLYKYIEAENEKWASIEEILSGLSHFKFQDFIALLFESMGYEVTKLPYVGDFGADLLANKGEDRVVVQVKKYGSGNKVGATEVQQTLGSTWKYDTRRAILVTTSTFTKQAYEQASNAPIELWDREKLKEILDQYLPSDLIRESPFKIHHSYIPILEEMYRKITSKVTSLATPQTAIRIKLEFERQNESFLIKMEGPLEMYPLLEKAITELLPLFPAWAPPNFKKLFMILPSLSSQFKRLFSVWLNTHVAKTELENLEKAYPFLSTT